MTESTPAPRITATLLKQALATRDGVIVHDLADGSVYALPYGLTKTQALDESLIVLITHYEAAYYLAEAGGNHAAAARTATTLVAWECNLVDTRLAAAGAVR